MTLYLHFITWVSEISNVSVGDSEIANDSSEHSGSTSLGYSGQSNELHDSFSCNGVLGLPE